MSLNFDLSLSGIRAGEIMLATTQNNVSNASNTSYARQRVELNAVGIPQGTTGVSAQLGSGVVVEEVKRLVSEMLIQQTRTESSAVGYYNAKSEVLTSVETAFAETSDSAFSELLDDFFASFEEVSKYPELSSYRVSAVYAAKNLAEKANSISRDLTTVAEQTDYEINTQITAVNRMLSDIADINAKMNKLSNNDLNALLDQRDKYLDELASYIDITVIRGSVDSDIEIKAGNTTILTGVETYPVKGFYDQEEDTWTLGATDSVLQSKSGSLTALIELRNVEIKSYENNLNDFIGTLINEINSLHSIGFGADNTTGIPLFIGANLSSIKVNETLLNEPQKLGLSAVNGVIGNVEISNKIAALAKSQFYNGKNPANFYQEFTVGFAADLNSVNNNKIVHETAHNTMEAQRQNIQGVNIDEEMTNLLSFQKFYQANSKTLSTTNEMLDTLLKVV